MVRFRPRYLKDYFWQSKARKALRWFLEIILVVALAFACTYSFGHQAVMKDISMEPTISSGETTLINVASYVFSSPKRGDVIAFKVSDDDTAEVQIKRIIGLPGETIQIKDRQIYINGEMYMEKMGFPLITNPGLAEEEIILGGTEYFVLGDNRNNSLDSRHVDIGNVDKDMIIAKLWLKLNPLTLIK